MSTALSSVANALQILQVLRKRGSMRLTEIAREVGCSVSTAHRLIATMRAERFVAQDPDTRQYMLGAAMLYTASTSAIEHCALVAEQPMRSLRDRLDETVHLTTLRGSESIFIAAAESSKLVRVSSRVGQHPKAHTTAAGKVLLAQLDSDRLSQLYPEEQLVISTSKGIRTRSQLLSELDIVKEQQFATNRGESETDMYAIAVPISRPAGDVVCSLSIAVPLSRVGAPGRELLSTEGVLEALRAAAREIEHLLAF